MVLQVLLQVDLSMAANLPQSLGTTRKICRRLRRKAKGLPVPQLRPGVSIHFMASGDGFNNGFNFSGVAAIVQTDFVVQPQNGSPSPDKSAGDGWRRPVASGPHENGPPAS
jgi:hypothetical protein